MTDWSKYSKAGNSCTNNLWTVPDWATPADSQTSSSQSDLSSQSGASPFDLYKQPGKETPICWETRRLGSEKFFGASAPLIRPERPGFQCQITPGNGNPADLSTLFYATLGGLGIARAYSRHLRDVLKEGSQEIAYRIYELKERFRNGNELNFQIQVDSSGKTTLIDQASFTDHSKNDKIIRYNIGKPNPSNNWEIEINFGDGKLTQNFVMEYPQGPDKPGRIRLSINQPKQAFVTAGTPFRMVSARFLATETTKAQPAKLVTLEYVEPAIPLTGNQGKGSYQIAHLSNGDVATIFTRDDLTPSNEKPSYIHRFPTARDQPPSYSPLKFNFYSGSPTIERYVSTQPYPFEFAVEKTTNGDQTVRRLQLMPSLDNGELTLNHLGVIKQQDTIEGIQLQPTPVTAMILAHDGDISITGEFAGEVLGLKIDPKHPLQISGEMKDGVFTPTFTNGQPQLINGIAYNANGEAFSVPLTIEIHPDPQTRYRATVIYGSGKAGDPGRPVHAIPYSNGKLFAIATPNQSKAVDQNLAALATEVGYTLPNRTDGGTTPPVVDLALLQVEMGKARRTQVNRSFLYGKVADSNNNPTSRSEGATFLYHGKIPTGSGDTNADFFSVDLGAGKRLELAGTLDESGTKFTPYLVR